MPEEFEDPNNIHSIAGPLPCPTCMVPLLLFKEQDSMTEYFIVCMKCKKGFQLIAPSTPLAWSTINMRYPGEE